MKSILIFSLMFLFSVYSYAEYSSYGENGEDIVGITDDIVLPPWKQNSKKALALDKNKNLVTGSAGADQDATKGEDGGILESFGGVKGVAIGSLAFAVASGANKNQILKMVGSATGAALITKGVAMITQPKPNPKGWAYIAGGMVVISVAAKAHKNSKQNKKVGKQVCAQGVAGCHKTLNASNTASTKPGGEFNGGTNDIIAEGIKAAKAQGVYVAANGDIVTPSKTIPASKTGSVSSLGAALGLSPSETARLKNDMKKIEAKAIKKYGGKAIATYGGGGSRTKQVVYEEEESRDDNRGARGLKNHYVASAKGLSTKLGDSMIGVRGDNIFKIISRSYKANKVYLLKQ